MEKLLFTLAVIAAFGVFVLGRVLVSADEEMSEETFETWKKRELEK